MESCDPFPSVKSCFQSLETEKLHRNHRDQGLSFPHSLQNNQPEPSKQNSPRAQKAKETKPTSRPSLLDLIGERQERSQVCAFCIGEKPNKRRFDCFQRVAEEACTACPALDIKSGPLAKDATTDVDPLYPTWLGFMRQAQMFEARTKSGIRFLT